MEFVRSWKNFVGLNGMYWKFLELDTVSQNLVGFHKPVNPRKALVGVSCIGKCQESWKVIEFGKKKS